MAANDFFRLTIDYTQLNKRMSSSLVYQQIAGADSLDDQADFLGLLVTNIDTALKAVLSSAVVIARYRFIQFTGTTRLARQTNYSDTHIGTNSAQPLPFNLAAIIRLRTDAPSGHSNGRIYIPGIAEDAIDSGIIEATEVAKLQTLANALALTVGPTATSSYSYRPMVLSWDTTVTPRVIKTSQIVLSAEAQSVMYNQRRRQSRSTASFAG